MCYFHVGLFVARVINQGPIMQIVTAQCTPSNAQSFPISHAPRLACVVLMSRTLINSATFSMSTAQFCYTLRIYNETDFPNWNQRHMTEIFSFALIASFFLRGANERNTR